MKLAEWARRNGVHPQTAYRWFREGTMPVPARRLPSGTIIVDPGVGNAQQGQVIVYARVSSADQRADLDRQVARVTAWATGRNLAVSRVVTEVGSALNGRRKKFLGLLRDPDVTTIVVEHRDRFPGAGGLGAGAGGLGAGASGTRGAGSGRPGVGMMGGGMGGGGHGTGDDDEHSTWLNEDEDVWGADTDAAPPVLGA